jgi:hypothetical protein
LYFLTASSIDWVCSRPGFPGVASDRFEQLLSFVVYMLAHINLREHKNVFPAARRVRHGALDPS